ncbi:MAG TPA: Zn-ribbon domain-containing OB-fold protein [Burkholderiaceae bacterium]|nr:Zn-ribbon domain-containing OB-fold protein [Burkholderiaceae bacterium]
MNPELPVPIVNADSLPYWEGAKEKRLMIRRCRACSVTHFLPRHLCPACWSEDLEWIQSSGRGIVHSFTVIRRAPMEAYRKQVPYVVALVDLEEGPRMMANILGADALETRIGDAVTVCYEERAEGSVVVQFQRSTA